MSVVDVMVVGQLTPHELPYQALGWAPIGVMTVTGIGLLTGVQVLAARAIGAGAPEQAGAAWRRGLVIAATAGVVAAVGTWLCGPHLFESFGIAPELARQASLVTNVLVLSVPLHLLYVVTTFFLEAIQRPIAATMVMWSANAANLVFNLALVPKLGAVGSAWATVGARVCLAAALVAWVLWSRETQGFSVRRATALPTYRSLLGVGAAAALSHAAESGAFSGMTILAGRLGADAVSGYQILLNLLAIVFMVSLGVSSATAVLTSEATGRSAARDAGLASGGGLALNTLLMLVAGAGLLVFSNSIGRAYTANLTLAAFVSSLLWLAALALPADGGQVVAAAALRARGDNWFPTASHLLSYALVMPALAYWLAEVSQRGVQGLMLAIFGSSLLSCTLLCLRLWHLHRQALRPSIG